MSNLLNLYTFFLFERQEYCPAKFLNLHTEILRGEPDPFVYKRQQQLQVHEEKKTANTFIDKNPERIDVKLKFSILLY